MKYMCSYLHILSSSDTLNNVDCVCILIFVRPNSFPYCEKRWLRWNYRKNLLFAELLELRSDIICLQEVDKANDFYQFLSGQGYAVTYIKRANKKRDGCLVAFRHSKFSLISPIYKVNFNDLCQLTAFLTDLLELRFLKTILLLIFIFLFSTKKSEQI